VRAVVRIHWHYRVSATYSGAAMSGDCSEITRLLKAVGDGQIVAVEELFPLIYDELRARAANLMAGERRDHTLQPTALVHEAYLKVARSGVTVQGKLQFYSLAAVAMRRILVDHALARKASKRGGGAVEHSLEDRDAVVDSSNVDLAALDESLNALKEKSARQHEVVMLRYFGGLTDAEIATLLDVSEKTVQRDWATAKLWLRAEMSK